MRARRSLRVGREHEGLNIRGEGKGGRAPGWLSWLMKTAATFLIVACLFLSGCCRRHYCEGLRQWRAQVAVGYEDCCRKPTEAERRACISAFGDRAQSALALDSAARIACDDGNSAEARAQVKRITALFPARIVTVAGPDAVSDKAKGGPRVVNTWVVFGERDWVEAGPKGAGVDLSPAAGTEVKPATDEGGAGGNGVYTVADGSTMNVRFGADPAVPVALSGTLTLADLRDSAAGKSARPADMRLKLTAVGATLTLTLDKSSPHNRLVTDAKGNGTLAFAATIDSDAPGLASCWYMGATLYFELPVRVSEGFGRVTLAMTRQTPAAAYTPVEPWVLRAADTPWKGKITDTPTADTDGDGIRDGASELIYAVCSQLDDDCGVVSH